MESSNSFTEKELTSKLEKVFEVFARAQEDWAMANAPGKATVDKKKKPIFRTKDAWKPLGQ